MEVITRTTPNAALAARLMPVRVFCDKFPHLFPSESSMRHFLRVRREELQRRNLLIETTSGLFVDAVHLADQLIEIIQLPMPDHISRAKQPAATAAKTTTETAK